MNKFKFLMLSLLASLSSTYGMDAPLTAEQLQEYFQIQQSEQQQTSSVSNKRKFESQEEESGDSKRSRIEIEEQEIPIEEEQEILEESKKRLADSELEDPSASKRRRIEAISILDFLSDMMDKIISFSPKNFFKTVSSVCKAWKIKDETVTSIVCFRTSNDQFREISVRFPNLRSLNLYLNSKITGGGIASLTNLVSLDLSLNILLPRKENHK